MDVDLLGRPLGGPRLTTIVVLPHQCLLLGIHRYDGLPLVLEDLGPPVKGLEWRIPVRVVAARERLAIGLETVAQVMEEPVDRPLTGCLPWRLEGRRQLRRTLACPSEQRHRVATGHGIDQGFQGRYEVRITRPQRLTSPAWTA